ncbi:unnamed protein product [Rhizophagus irregularis]|nr:unnamed protein product [Rhizophagus irregularis]
MSYTTRSSTSKNNKKNIQKQNKNTQQNTNIDETIVEDTYSTRKLSDDETPNPRPSKIRATHIEDNNNTNDNNPDDMDINEENTHSLSNSEMDISSHDQIKKNNDQTPINNEQDSMETDQHNHNQDNTNTPDQHSIKGKAKINNDDILHLSNIFDKEKSRNSYIYELTQENINTLILNKLQRQDNNINDTNQIQTQQKTKPTNNQNNTFNKDNDNHTRHKSQEGHYNPSTSHTTPTMNEKLLLEKICTLENSIKDLQIEINNLNKNQIEMNQKIQTNKSNIDICMNAQTQFNEKQDENNRIVNNINNNVNKLVEKISTNFSSITNTNIDQYTPQCPTPYHNIPYDNIKSIALSKTKDNENISQDEYYETESNYSSGSNTITEHIVEPDADANPSNYSFGKVLSTINLFHGNNKNNNNTRW